MSDWQPEKYVNGSYTCHWDKYAVPRAPEDYVTIVDSTSILRIQFEEFSFSYCVNFEVATYDNGAIRKKMPHYTPVITDLGVTGEMEPLETICRNDSVFARRVLHHSVKVTVGPKSEILHAKVTLYRYMPYANPNKFVVRSEVLGEITESYVEPDSVLANRAKYYYNFNMRRYYSDGEITELPVNKGMNVPVGRIEDQYSPYVPCDDMQGYTYSHVTYNNSRAYFHYTGTEYTSDIYYKPSDKKELIFDNGYTALYKEPSHVTLEYSRTRYICDANTQINRLRTYVILTVDNHPPQEVYIERIFFQ